jgi:hypothetical protein
MALNGRGIQDTATNGISPSSKKIDHPLTSTNSTH